MKLTDMQQALLTLQLTNLGQSDLSANDQDVLVHIEIMLSMALENVRSNINTKVTLGGVLPPCWVFKAKKDDTNNDH